MHTVVCNDDGPDDCASRVTGFDDYSKGGGEIP